MRGYMKALERFAAAVKKRYGDRVEKVVLFGSAKSGKVRGESDIDILVVVDEKEREIVRGIEDLAFGASKEVGVIVSTIVVGRAVYEDMQRENYPFIVGIDREGAVLA